MEACSTTTIASAAVHRAGLISANKDHFLARIQTSSTYVESRFPSTENFESRFRRHGGLEGVHPGVLPQHRARLDGHASASRDTMSPSTSLVSLMHPNLFSSHSGARNSRHTARLTSIPNSIPRDSRLGRRCGHL